MNSNTPVESAPEIGLGQGRWGLAVEKDTRAAVLLLAAEMTRFPIHLRGAVEPGPVAATVLLVTAPSAEATAVASWAGEGDCELHGVRQAGRLC